MTSRLVSAGQNQVALRHLEEASAERIEPEPHPLLAETRVQVLEVDDATRGASPGRKHPRPAAPGEAVAFCETALKDRPVLPGA